MHACTQLKKSRCTAQKLGARHVFKPTILFLYKKNGVNSLPTFSYPDEYWMASLSISPRLRLHRTSYYRICSRQDMIRLFLRRMWFNNSKNYSQKNMPLNNHAILRLIIKKSISEVSLSHDAFFTGEFMKKKYYIPVCMLNSNLLRRRYDCRWYSHILQICGHLILGPYT